MVTILETFKPFRQSNSFSNNEQLIARSFINETSKYNNLTQKHAIELALNRLSKGEDIDIALILVASIDANSETETYQFKRGIENILNAKSNRQRPQQNKVLAVSINLDSDTNRKFLKQIAKNSNSKISKTGLEALQNNDLEKVYLLIDKSLDSKSKLNILTPSEFVNYSNVPEERDSELRISTGESQSQESPRNLLSNARLKLHSNTSVPLSVIESIGKSFKSNPEDSDFKAGIRAILGEDSKNKAVKVYLDKNHREFGVAYSAVSESSGLVTSFELGKQQAVYLFSINENNELIAELEKNEQKLEINFNDQASRQTLDTIAKYISENSGELNNLNIDKLNSEISKYGFTVKINELDNKPSLELSHISGSIDNDKVNAYRIAVDYQTSGDNPNLKLKFTLLNNNLGTEVELDSDAQYNFEILYNIF
ncbi:MAG: hypothetical protein HRT47_09230 [Candidatus Caenarcaniphilales bacterium]|nr:hypothetical protein [Candidatus Caenarcaniphilales bacterium]